MEWRRRRRKMIRLVLRRWKEFNLFSRLRRSPILRNEWRVILSCYTPLNVSRLAGASRYGGGAAGSMSISVGTLATAPISGGQSITWGSTSSPRVVHGNSFTLPPPPPGFYFRLNQAHRGLP
ncbi:hypothetical protein Salat_2708000 [Sesamum alatum]|uniref:Uncharacterized protein n=1 Tax=Sesamum alatum TaxID=300844 RepID=A0AAE1XQC2_9LAMI|nr:hypothetical protein Salat_2708000 [Sesamum alatum]